MTPDHSGGNARFGHKSEQKGEKMNAAKLEYEMKINGVSKAEICDFLGMSRTTFYRKCNGKSEFTQSEIQKIVDYLHLESPMGIFFAEKVS